MIDTAHQANNVLIALGVDSSFKCLVVYLQHK